MPQRENHPYEPPQASVDDGAEPDRGDIGHGFFIGAAGLALGVFAYMAMRVAEQALGPLPSPLHEAFRMSWILVVPGGAALVAMRFLSRGLTLSAWGVLLVTVLFVGPVVAYQL